MSNFNEVLEKAFPKECIKESLEILRESEKENKICPNCNLIVVNKPSNGHVMTAIAGGMYKFCYEQCNGEIFK